MSILTKTVASSSFSLQTVLIFLRFNFFGKIVFEVDKMCYNKYSFNEVIGYLYSNDLVICTKPCFIITDSSSPTYLSVYDIKHSCIGKINKK